MNPEEEEISLTETETTETEKPQEQAPSWASEMANAMRGIADRVTRPAPVAAPGLTKDQVDDINSRITKGIVDGNPLGTLAPLASQVAQEIVDGRMAPVIQEAVDGFVDRFKTRKKDEASDKGQQALYRQVTKQFDKELEGEDLASLVTRPKAERDRVLDRAWRAATGEVLEKKVAVRESRPAGASASGGGGMASASNGAYKLSDREKAQLYRTMPKEKADKEIADIERMMAGVAE